MTQSTAERARRLGLRCLMVAGLASAAWLLGTSAAHAAGPSEPDGPDGLSVVGLVAELGQGLLGPEQAATPVPAGTADSVSAVTAPVSAVAAPVAAPVSTMTGTAVGLVGPVAQALSLSPEPASPVARPGGGRFVAARPGWTATATAATTTVPAPAGVAGAGAVAGPTVPAPTQSTVDSVRAPDGHRAVATGRVAIGGSGARAGSVPDRARWIGTRTAADAPVRPIPAPFPGNPGTGAGPGAGTGSGAMGTGSYQDGGVAVVPSSVVGSTVAVHRLPVRTEPAVSRLDAEDRTFSPD